MFRTVVKIDGMMCGMCEAHINDAIRRNFNVKKVKSSHSKGETVIAPADPLRSVDCVKQRCDLIDKNLEYLKSIGE